MRNLLIIFLIACMPMAARGLPTIDIDLSGLPQPTSANALHYWFDNDEASIQVTYQLSGSYDIDVETLGQGLHTLHYQLFDDSGMAGYIGSSLFMKIDNANTETFQAQKLMYWFDDEETINQADLGEGVQLIDASELIEGLHTLHYQVFDDSGMAGYIGSSLFMKIDNANDETVQAQKLMYWFDNEETIQQVDLGEGAQLIDASELIEGLHTLHYQVLCDNGQMTPSMSTLFLRVGEDSEPAVAKSIRYWFDEGQSSSEIDINDGILVLDASELADGLHTVHYQIEDNNGRLGTPYSSMFLKMDAVASSEAESLRYWFDDDISTLTTTSVANGTQSIEVSSLMTGLHALHYQLVDDKGVASIPVTRLFFKIFDKAIEEGQNRITKYQYWLNKNTQDLQTVTLDDAPNPFTLITLLPLQAEPIHSSLFHFEMNGDVPTVYAKNTLYARFYDAQNYFNDGIRTFIDYNVSQALSDVERIESGVRVTIPKLDEDVIKWYCLDAEPGDSLQFKIDRAATLQLFAPSGEEVYSASGVDAVNWGGLHVFETGTYYLALHDVTATYGNSINIDYNHIDKYAVLRQDVNVVGNGGCSTITFEGNGFRDLYAVELYNDYGDVITHEYIGHESDARTSVVFDFNGLEIGNYHALFHFTDEDRYYANPVTVENARVIDLVTSVTYPARFLRGTSVTYTVKITNKGNMTAYAVPIYTWLKCKTINGISHIEYEGLDLPKLFDGIDTESLTETEISNLRALSNAAGDDHYFIKLLTPDKNNPGDSVLIRSNFFITNISPNETKTLHLTITANEDLEVYFTIPQEQIPYEMKQSNVRTGERAKSQNAGLKESYCCVRGKWECLASITADVVSLADQIIDILGPGTPANAGFGIASCVFDIINQLVSATGDVLCDENSNPEAELWEKIKSITNGISMASTVASCVSNFLPDGKMIKKVLDAINNKPGQSFLFGFGVGVDIQGCYSSFTEKIPGCPPVPPSGGPIPSFSSFDPNDIYGYAAESLSKAIKDELTDVYYTVQFENDPKFATAAAHEIVVADTLDASKFDLATFAPTRVKIGEKSADLNGDKNFVTTIDMRPAINAIAQVEGTYDQTTGIARWHITSLDPMTMEPTNDPMDGVLPVNANGNGIGEVSYDIKLKDGLAHGTEVKNRAGIVFDSNESILTPTWTNVIDRVAPESHVTDVRMQNDSTVTVSIEATDELSGPWRYNVYVQYGSGAWFLGAENVPADTTASVKVYEGIDHGFYVVAIDSAGNYESKEPVREFSFEVFASQVDTDTKLQLAQGWNWISHNQQEALSAETLKPNARRIVSQTDELYRDDRIGWTGTLTELLPTELYKVEMTGTDEVQLGGRLFNASFRNVPLYAGWNWIGYPVANAMSPSQALQKMEAEEGDFIVGQDGMTTYSNGQWTGTLTEMQPGQGYMYRSVSNKSLFLNATAQNRARRHEAATSASNDGAPIPESWTVDKRKYPNVMGMVADLLIDEVPADAGYWLLAAFSGAECRGLSQPVDGHLMMNVYGTGGELITFLALNRASGEVVTVVENESFRSDILGTLQQPYELHNGMATGITELEEGTPSIDNATVIDLLGRPVNKTTKTGEGVYIVTDGEKKEKRVTTQSPKP